MAENVTIYTGVWTDWEHGKIMGSTITLRSRDASILNSFITATLVFTGSQMWKILVYIVHQTRYREDLVDGFQHQQRVLLRNSSNPGPVAWALILQWWSWKNARRTIIPLVLTLLYLAAVTVVSVLVPSKLVAHGGRLLIPGQCGYDSDAAGYFNRKYVLRSQQGSSYSLNCYENFDPLICQPFPVLKTYLERNVSCPFGNICSYTNGSVPFTLSTDLIDTRTHLGINTQQSIQYRLRRQCSLINFDTYTINGSASEQYCTGNTAYYVGPYLGKNYTFITPTCAYLFHTLYDIQTRVALPCGDGACQNYWEPIPALRRNDAMLTLVLVLKNTIAAIEPIDDPLFSFHSPVKGDTNGTPRTYYFADSIASMMACADQYQVCDPSTKRCSNLGDPQAGFVGPSAQALNLTLAQNGLVKRVWEGLFVSTLEKTILNRGGSILRASSLLADDRQWPLPNDQYIREAQSWFMTGLATMQMEISRFASGAPNNSLEKDFTRATQETKDFQKLMCSNQLTQITGGTISYSLFYLLLVLCLCVLIIGISYGLEPCVRLLSRRYYPASKTANKTTTLWILDDVFRLQALMFEALGLMTWTYDTFMPVSQDREKAFGAIDDSTRDARFAHAGIDTDEVTEYIGKEDTQAAAPQFLIPRKPLPTVTTWTLGPSDTASSTGSHRTP